MLGGFVRSALDDALCEKIGEVYGRLMNTKGMRFYKPSAKPMETLGPTWISHMASNYGYSIRSFPVNTGPSEPSNLSPLQPKDWVPILMSTPIPVSNVLVIEYSLDMEYDLLTNGVQRQHFVATGRSMIPFHLLDGNTRYSSRRRRKNLILAFFTKAYIHELDDEASFITSQGISPEDTIWWLTTNMASLTPLAIDLNGHMHHIDKDTSFLIDKGITSRMELDFDISVFFSQCLFL